MDPAAHGHVNLNIDGTYIKETGEACVGMILPDNTGGIIFSACRNILRCVSPVQAELESMFGGAKVCIAMVYTAN